MRRPSLPVLTAILLAGAAVPASADGVENVVVTATRSAQPAQVTGESISVFDSQQLQSLQSVDLGSVLSLAPGLAVDRNGGFGQPTSVSIRGAETGQTLVLIDGVRINDPSGTDDGAILGDVLINNVDRIEVLRGPQSTLYGSDAIGGVVDILTRRGGDSPFALNATAEGGSFDTYHMNAAANGTAGGVDYGAAVNFLHSNGISAADARNGNPETDGYGNFGATANARLHINDNVSVDLRGYYTVARAGFDDNSGFVPPYPPSDSLAYNRNRFAAGYAGVNFDFFGGALRNRMAIMATASDRAFYNSAFDPVPGQKDSENRGYSTRLEYQGIADLSSSDQIVFGAEDENTRFTGVSSFSNERGRTSIYGFYAQYQKTLFEALTLTGGVRYDRHDRFGAHTSLKLAAAWQVTNSTTLHANYGDGFKAPSLYELFSEFGTPGLRPETARGWEAGADRTFIDGRIHAALTYFARDTNDLIDFQSCFVAAPPAQCAVQPSGFYFNIGRTRATGIEAELSGNITDTLTLTVDYTHLDSKDRTTGLELTRRPRDSASAILTWSPAKNWGLGASLSYAGREIDQYDMSTTPPAAFINGSHTVLNLYGHYDFEHWGLYGRIENAMNLHYEPLLGYGAEGRAFFAGVRVKD